MNSALGELISYREITVHSLILVARVLGGLAVFLWTPF